jgi:nitrite reductase/ring-hydroxylating ferredoxin subunit
MSIENTKKNPNPDCDGCTLASRRSFLFTTAGLVAAALAGLGLDSARAAALPVHSALARRVGQADRAYPIPATDGVTIDRDNDVILVRYQNKVFAFSLACPHQNTALRWLQAENRFQCPKHKSRYAPDGTFLSGRATRSMDRFAVRKDGTNVVVDIAHLFEQDKNAKEWESAWVEV